jgi:dCMP deaminase
LDSSKKWDYRFLELAESVSKWSKDPSTKVGSVIVDSKRRVIGLGYNGFPRGVKDSEDRYNDRETKLLFVSHAERNALDNAPGSVEGATLYATMFPCNECCKSIIQKGITRIVTFVPSRAKYLLYNYDNSYTMLNESGVKVYQYDYGLYERWKNGSTDNAEASTGKRMQGVIYEAGRHSSGYGLYSDGIDYRSTRKEDRSCED